MQVNSNDQSLLKVDTIQDQSGNNIINESADTITIGASGDTITIPSGATMTVPSGGLSGQNYPAFEAYLSATTTISDSIATKVQFNTETLDTDNCYDNSTNYRFTPTVAGKYYVYSTLETGADTNTALGTNALYIYKNGSNYSLIANVYNANYIRRSTLTMSAIVDMNGSSDYLEIFTYIDNTSGNAQIVEESKSNKFGAYRIGD
jgi:hypothetical protein